MDLIVLWASIVAYYGLYGGSILLKHHFVHHDFKDDIAELMADFGLTAQEAEGVARDWIADLASSHPSLYNILESNHGHGCDKCQDGGRVAVRFFTSNIKLRKKAEAPSIKAPPVPKNPYFDDPNDGHSVTIPVRGPEGIKNIAPGTPEWDTTNEVVKKHFNGKADLHDITRAYHIPGLKNNLHIEPFRGESAFMVQHFAEPREPNGPNMRFRSDMVHTEPPHLPGSGPQVNWGIMQNETGNPRIAYDYMRRLMPMYQKAGVKAINTEATGSPGTKKERGHQKWNGTTTWANLGFDFKSNYGPEDLRYNLLNHYYARRGQDDGYKQVKSELDGLQRPHEFLHYLKSSPHFKGMGTPKDIFDKGVNYEYKATLPLTDPSHPGLQRARRLLLGREGNATN